jgi:hypothetical protein
MPDQRQSHNIPHQEEGSRDSSRTLIYLPIIHSAADMGEFKESVTAATINKLGRAGLARKASAVDRIWSEIDAAISSLNLPFDRVRLYQDGLPVCGRETEIVTDLAQKGSRNHQLLLRLMSQGATLVGTESAELLVQEYQLAKKSLAGHPPQAAGVAAAQKTASEQLLQQRDQSIAQRINDMLKPGETGILFLGMLHSLAPYLQPDIKVVRGFSEYALEALLAYNWPGNVRQLRSVIRRALLLADDLVTERHLEIKRAPVPGMAFTPRIEGAPWQELSLKEIVHRSVATVEREVLLQVMKYTKGNKAKAARLSQIDYKTMHTKMKQFGINRSGGSYE